MKNLLKDIMKLDLSKFSKPKKNSIQTKETEEDKSKRRVLPSPAPSDKTVPTQASQPSKRAL